MTIRRTPDDFFVEELLNDHVRAALALTGDAAHSHVVYELTKTSLTTPEALHWLAKSLNVREGQIAYAGLKDKHARTIQHASVHAVEQREWPTELQGENGRGWSARLIGWSPAELSAASITGNRFTIVVRDLTNPAAHDMSRRANVLSLEERSTAKPDPSKPYVPQPRRLLMVNYFGDQRFGSARHGEGWIAAHLVRGEFEHALRLSIATPARKETGDKRTFSRLAAAQWGDWQILATQLPRCPERRAIEELAAGKSFREAFAALPAFFQQICVEAHQSHLWNEMVRTFVAERAAAAAAEEGEARKSPGIEAEDPFGMMLFPRAAGVEEHVRELVAPMLAPETKLDATWRDIATGVLADRGLSLEELRIPGLRRPAYGDASRPVFALVKDFTMSAAEPDELSSVGKRFRRTLRFELPRGSYATVLLRALGQ